LSDHICEFSIVFIWSVESFAHTLAGSLEYNNVLLMPRLIIMATQQHII
jgi:hypothetical protein